MDEANNAMAKQQFMMQHQHQQQLLLLQQYQQQQQQQQQQIQQQQHQQQIQQQQQQQQIQQQQIQQKQGSQQQQQQHIQLQQQQQIQQQQHQHQHQQQIQQQQIQQQQQQQQQQIQQQHIQQQQQAISRFPSNIDAHLRSPGLRSLHLQQQLQQQQQQQNMQQQQQQQQQQNMQLQQQKGAAVLRQGTQVEVEMAQQDAWKVCNPDIKTPFSNLEDAVNRLLPYHVVADFEAEEDDMILDSDTTGQIHSRLQQWDHNILAKIAEFTGTFEKQVLAFNIMSRKRAIGEFRAEERLLIEQALLQEEKQTLLQLRAEVESREKAGREAAVEAKMRMAMVQAEQARIEAQAHAEMIARAPMRANAIGSHHSNDGTAHDMGQEQGGNMDETIHGWGSTHRDEGEPSDDFLNDENEPENENEETGLQDEWREVGELDLNTR